MARALVPGRRKPADRHVPRIPTTRFLAFGRPLESGAWQGGRRSFLAARRPEREADWFAAALLMPRQSVVERVQKTKGLCRLRDLAERVYQTSLLRMALRYVQLNFAPCGVVLSQAGQVRFAMPSDALRDCRPGDNPGIPEASLTGRLLAARAQGRWSRDRGVVPAGIWFPEASALPLWEEVKVLGGTGLALTYLALGARDGGETRASGQETYGSQASFVRVKGEEAPQAGRVQQQGRRPRAGPGWGG